MSTEDREAEVIDFSEYDSDLGFTVNLKKDGENCSVVTAKSYDEAKRIKENWENGSYQYLTES